MNKKTDFFGNSGDELFTVPVSFTRNGTLFRFDVEVATYSREAAAELASDIPDTPVGKVYFSKDRFANADRETIVSILKSIDGVSNVSSDYTGEADFDFCVDENEDDAIREDDDELEEEDEEEFEDEEDGEEICEDDFGNEGEKFWWVPMEFAMETFVDNEVGEGEVKKFTFHLKIAADNEEEAVRRAGEVALQDITGDSDDDECFCGMTEDDIVVDLNTQHDSTCDADWEDSDRTFYLRVNEDEDVEECFI